MKSAMATTKLPNLLALFFISVFTCSYWINPVNALSVDTHHLARRGHEAIALRKRTTSNKQCKVRPSSSSPTPTPTPTPTPAPAAIKAEPITSSKTSTSVESVSTPSSGSSFIGLAWPNGDDPALANFKGAHVKKSYSWSPQYPPQAKSLGFDPMPMLWCDNQVADFQRLVVKGYASIALGMNEPNEAGQCNISPQHGADLWMQHIQPLKALGYTLVSPATSSAPSGKQWMKDFFAACQQCTVDMVAAHYYDVTAQGLISYMTDFHNTFNKPIMVTEFACQNFNGGAQCSKDEVFGFMSQVLSFCRDTPWIDSCFPFGAMRDMQGVNDLDRLMNQDGSPTDLGWFVLNF